MLKIVDEQWTSAVINAETVDEIANEIIGCIHKT